MGTPKIILSIDGGGIRGIIPAVVLVEIEKRLRKRLGRDDARLSACIDLVAGTSTGSLIACGLGAVEDGGPAFSAREILDIYLEHGPSIFDRSVGRVLAGVAQLGEEKYSNAPLLKLLQDLLGPRTTLAELTAGPKVMVTSYDLIQRKPIILKSWRDDYNDVLAWQAAAASSSAPTYFEPLPVTVEGVETLLIDGGVCVNNPTASAWAEMVRLMREDGGAAEDVRVISLGTGEPGDDKRYERARSWNRLQWIGPLLDAMFDGMADIVDYQMKYMVGENYIRLQEPLQSADEDMDNASPRNINRLRADGNRVVGQNSQQLDTIVDWLEERYPVD